MKTKPNLNLAPKFLRKLNWGVAGLGSFAEKSVLPTLNMLAKSKIVSLYSHNLKRAENLAVQYSAKAFDDFNEFLNSGIDVVYIASSNNYHYEQTIASARAGKHILCEKPLSIRSEEAREMVKICKENNVFLSVNYVYRFHPLVRKAKELLDKGMIGKIISISANFNIDYPPNENYRFKRLAGGGPLRDLGTHVINLLIYFGGRVVDVKGYMDNVIYKSEVEDFATGLFKFEKGGYGQFNVSFNAAKAPNSIVVQGHKGYLTIENMIARKFHPVKLVIDLEGESKKTFRRKANKFLIRLRSFQKSILNGEEPEVTGEEGVMNIEIMEKFEEECNR